MTLHRHSIVQAVGCSILLATGLFVSRTVGYGTIGANSHNHRCQRKIHALTAAQIASLPRVTVNTVEHDAPARFEGVSPARLLALAGIPMGDTLRGAANERGAGGFPYERWKTRSIASSPEPSRSSALPTAVHA
jgi:hypothetical protein